jgi:hypothetical protein
MAQRIQTVCDVHQARDEEADGLTWTVAFTAPGARSATTYEIDLCPDDAKGLSDVLDMVGDLGRRVDGPGRPRANGRASTPPRESGARGGHAAIAAGKAAGPYTCTDCGRDNFATPQALGVHRARLHGVPGKTKAAQAAASGSDE